MVDASVTFSIKISLFVFFFCAGIRLELISAYTLTQIAVCVPFVLALELLACLVLMALCFYCLKSYISLAEIKLLMLNVSCCSCLNTTLFRLYDLRMSLTCFGIDISRLIIDARPNEMDFEGNCVLFSSCSFVSRFWFSGCSCESSASLSDACCLSLVTM